MNYFLHSHNFIFDLKYICWINIDLYFYIFYLIDFYSKFEKNVFEWFYRYYYFFNFLY